ncbi:dehydrogenase [Ketobacter alkanivorans]|uniref:Dehydrogenase n=1 Tax=Ketobacter alkanivorans TaxID=1917421 RepID=A0A2K9LM51_9GAMM|nr:dehydrogenase [Ketobacter alkanivorans]AUM12565.1 dehydrogenase [Ketobacter alkanivorans]
MKTIISISLECSEQDYEFTAEFLGQEFHIKRIGVDKDTKQAELLIKQWQYKADAIALEGLRDHQRVGTFELQQKLINRLEGLSQDIPITSGTRLREILQEWSVRHTQNSLKGFFNNSNVLIFSGMNHYRTARVLTEFTENLRFGDPVLQLGVPKFLSSFEALELFAKGSHQILRWTPPHVLSPSVAPIKEWNHYIMRKAMHKADVVVAFYEELERYGLEELAGKTVITAAVSEQRLHHLQEKGVNMVLDYSPQPFKDQTISIVVMEAMIMAAVGKQRERVTDDDLLEIITDLELEPRTLYPNGFKRTSRFAFVIHPLSQQYFRNAKPLDLVSKVSPPVVMNTLERIIAYAPPFIYSRVTGIASPTGAEAEGWLISVGGTPKEIMAHSPEFTYRRLLAAADMAKKLGAQIMGLGAFTKVVGDAGITVAKRAPLPITTGNSYSASGALWAAHDAVHKLGLVQIGSSGKMAGKAMIVGATGAIGSVCARLLAKAADEIYLVAPEPAKLLALKEDIQQESPGANVHVTAKADKHLGDMDMIVTATSGAGKKILDIMQVKPGCVITDVARPLDIPPEDVAKRPDVLVIESGEIRLPGDVHMKDIGLPKNVVYACLAETIVLALEGRYENFTLGRNIEWEKVREIYKLGIKHGMQLASISGVNGVYSDEDLQKIRSLALQKRPELKAQLTASSDQ